MCKGREARADTNFARNPNAVDTATEDRGVKRCDAGETFSQTGQRTICDRRVERHAEVYTVTGVSGSFSPRDLHRFFWEAGLDQRVKPHGRVHPKKWVMVMRSECAELGAVAIVPEGDASEPLYSARDTSSTPKRQRSVTCSGKGSSSPRGEEGRQASQRGGLHRSQSTKADGG